MWVVLNGFIMEVNVCVDDLKLASDPHPAAQQIQHRHANG